MSESEQTIRRYLFGELSESEQSAFEEKYFTDRPVFDQFLKVESELVDSYVRGRLPFDLRRRFELSYMAQPSRKRRVKFAAALANRLDEMEAPETVGEQGALPHAWWRRIGAMLSREGPTLKLGIAFALLLVIMGGAWLLIDNRKRQNEFARTQADHEAEQQRAREQSIKNSNEEPASHQAAVNHNPQPPPQPSPNPTETSGPRSVSLALTFGVVRGGGGGQIPTLVITPATTQARLLLNLQESNYPSYQASLKTVAGEEVFNQSNVKPERTKSGASFVFTLPAHRLSPGDYVLTLRGSNPDGEVDDLSKSLFRVEKR